MFPKAYRWVAEMEEIGHFLGEGAPAGDMFAAIARLYEDIAADAREPDPENGPIAPLAQFYAPTGEAQARKRA